MIITYEKVIERYSMNHKINLINHLLFLKGSEKVVKHQLDIWVISETRSLMINRSECERTSGASHRYSMNHKIKLIAITNSGAIF